MEEFDLVNSPLAGRNLIEASAGTGKTYAIAGLYVRLVVERAVPVREILVVTYTVAATEELRGRIRGRLREAEAALGRGGTDAGDVLLAGLAGRYPPGPAREGARRLLRRAVRDFDEAAIFTIHGFCQRSLQENAFESGSLFDARLLPDEHALREEVIRDFWRLHFYGAGPEFIGYALSQKANPAFYLTLLRKATANPDTAIVPDVSPPAADKENGALAAFQAAYRRVREAWCAQGAEIAALLRAAPLKANVYGRRIDALALAMDEYCREGEAGFPLCEGFGRFTPAALAGATKVRCEPPRHGFFLLCEEAQRRAEALRDVFDCRLLFLKAEAVRMARRELPARKERRHVLAYDDLLLRLRLALRGSGGQALAAAVRGAYRAALIDEFQDTDPIQYAIFDALFPPAAAGCGNGDFCLFLIGDPKQAIYGFRGADVFAYLQAASQVDAAYTLRENWRSAPALVAAVSALFLRNRQPFVYGGIGFAPARAADVRERAQLLLDGRREPPLVVWFVSGEVREDGTGGDPGKPVPRNTAEPRIARAVAAEIGRLIAQGRRGEARIGERAVAAADIAVLVRTNREAGIVQDALRAARIPSVVSSRENVFATAEAGQMARLLEAVAAPHEEDLVRAALADDLFGVDAAGIDGLLRDEEAWGGRIARFHAYRELWREGGFIRMFRLLMAEEGVAARLLALPDGERRLTNVLHIAELLHRASHEEGLTMRGLRAWLAGQRADGEARPEEHELRLESDERAVTIVTIHKSKGLQYEIVFCPFLWHGAGPRRQEALVYHDPERNYLPVCDVGSEDYDAHRELAEKETLAENVRLFYVALTRAKHRCYLVWGRFKGAEASAPAYLFHPPTGAAAEPAGAVWGRDTKDPERRDCAANAQDPPDLKLPASRMTPAASAHAGDLEDPSVRAEPGCETHVKTTAEPGSPKNPAGTADPDGAEEDRGGACADESGDYLSRSEDRLYADLEEIAREAAGTIQLSRLPEGSAAPLPREAEGEADLRCREFPGNVDRSWRMASFSFLAASGDVETGMAGAWAAVSAAEVPDRDARAEGADGDAMDEDDEDRRFVDEASYLPDNGGVAEHAGEENTLSGGADGAAGAEEAAGGGALYGSGPFGMPGRATGATGPRPAVAGIGHGAPGIAQFPRGAAAGTFFHDLIEHFDFRETDGEAVRALAAEKLAAHGFAAAWAPAVANALDRIVRTPLLDASPEEGGFAAELMRCAAQASERQKTSLTLSLIPREERLTELEFTFPLRRIGPEDLEAIFTAAAQTGGAAGNAGGGASGAVTAAADILRAGGFPERLGRLRFSPVRGFMKGFIDLVFRYDGRFYLVDWKSNSLGERPEDYGPDALAAAMEEGLYFLQYHLYTAALHRYLALRMPDYDYEHHFGGVFYCFLRGMDPARGASCGVFRDRPSAAFIEALCTRLIDA